MERALLDPASSFCGHRIIAHLQISDELAPQCISKDSRLLTPQLDEAQGAALLTLVFAVHTFAVVSCAYVRVLWLSIILYSTMFLLSIFSTLAEAMSGYIENCFNLFSLFIILHIGMAIGLFHLHMLFIYTHRGITFYQWIPLKMRQFYLFLTEKRYPKDHLIQQLEGMETTLEKYEKVSLRTRGPRERNTH